MKRLSKSQMRLIGIATAFAAIGVAPPARAADFFVNNTGAPVTDFHFDQFTTFVPRIPKSFPWGDGTLTSLGDGNYTVTYSGTAIPVGGTLRFANGSFTDDTSHEFSNFVWTPGGQSADLQHGTGKVPEPNIWMTMLVGFGAVGGALRLKKRTESTLQFQ